MGREKVERKRKGASGSTEYGREEARGMRERGRNKNESEREGRVWVRGSKRQGFFVISRSFGRTAVFQRDRGAGREQ